MRFPKDGTPVGVLLLEPAGHGTTHWVAYAPDGRRVPGATLSAREGARHLVHLAGL